MTDALSGCNEVTIIMHNYKELVGKKKDVKTVCAQYALSCFPLCQTAGEAIRHTMC